MEDQLKKFKKLIDADDLLTNKYRLIIEKEYEELLFKYLNEKDNSLLSVPKKDNSLISGNREEAVKELLSIVNKLNIPYKENNPSASKAHYFTINNRIVIENYNSRNCHIGLLTTLDTDRGVDINKLLEWNEPFRQHPGRFQYNPLGKPKNDIIEIFKLIKD